MMDYNLQLQDSQRAILSNLNGYDLNNFYYNSLVNFIDKFCGEQAEEIDELKKETTKEKRVAKVFETMKSTKTELLIKG